MAAPVGMLHSWAVAGVVDEMAEGKTRQTRLADLRDLRDRRDRELADVREGSRWKAL